MPEHIICPITQAVMKDPVIDINGHTYERWAIERWLAEHNTSPMTGLVTTDQLIPNRALRESIEEWQKKFAELEKENAELEKRNAELEKENAELKKKHKFAWTVIHEAMKENAEVKAECDKLRRSMEWTKETMTAVQENLLEEIEDLKEMFAELEKENAELNAMKSNWSLSLDRSIQMGIYLEGKLRDRVEKLEKENAELEMKHNFAWTVIRKARNESEELLEENAKVKAECEELRQSLKWRKETSTTVKEHLLKEIADLKEMLKNEKKLKRKVTWAPNKEPGEVRKF